MNTRVNRTGSGAKGGWLWALAAVCCLVIGLGSVRAVVPVVSEDAAVVEGDATGSPHSLVLAAPVATTQAIATPDAPSVAGCPITALVSDGTTSQNERAPNSNFLFGRAVWLITAAELAANGLPSGTVPSAIGFRYTTAPGVVATGTLRVYLQNTADTTNNKSTNWTTAITGMTQVHFNAATSLPNTTAPFDITFTGGSPFTYTGGGLYVAFDWSWGGPATTTAAVACNTALLSGLKGAQAATLPTTISASNFRPETRLTPSVATVFNDASVDFVISLGSLAQPLVGPQTVQAVITNRGVNPLTNLPVTFDLTGAETFTNTQTVATLAACGGQTTVPFAPFTPAAIGSDTVTVTVPADDVAGNNSKNRPLDETFNLYSYKHPGTTAAGGVGVNSNTADFVAKFTTTAAAKVSAINLEFPLVSATTYRVAIYPDSGTGTPGLVPLYEDAADRTVTVAGPVSITLPSPVPVGPGNFYAGIQQTNTTNAGLSFDAETPIRVGAFYLAVPHPATAWFDFAPGNNFKLNIGVTLVQCAIAAECNDNNDCTDDACTNNLCTHVNNNATSCDGNPCSNPDQCLNGTCIPGPNPCNDNNVCTIDLCDGQGGCLYSPLDCNDNNPCTDDSCIPGSGCAHSDNSGRICPSDGNVCTTETCVPATGSCVSINNTNACDDGNTCTTGDICGPTFSENFDGEIAPNLPGTWSSSVTGTGDTWSSVNTSSDSAPNSAFGFDGPAVADEVLISPPINITTATAKLTFRNRWSFESATSCFDAGVLEISIGGGAFTDIVTAGGSFVSGGYTGIVSSSFSNPLAARSAWCTVSAGYPAYLTTVVNLPAAAAGQAIQLQWRIGTDTSANAPGQNIDSIVLIDGSNVCNPGSAVNCDDGNPCTDDSCDPILGCQHADNTDACDDGNACTILDTCSGGACGGTAIVCNDSNPCTVDTCVPATGCNFAPITAPPETQNVKAAADKATYNWDAAAFATRYDVVRGSLSALPVGPGNLDEVCFDDLAGTTLNDPTPPGAGTGFWYLSRGENSCGDGTYGNQGVNGAPGAPRITTTCP